jgi:hypothetical protein
MGQTNEQQRRFNEWPISEFHVEVDSIQTSLKLRFTCSNIGMSSLTFSSARIFWMCHGLFFSRRLCLFLTA